MGRLRALGTCIALLALCSPAAADPTLLGHSGRWIVDGQGRVHIFHGVGVMNYSPPNLPAAMGFGDKDAAYLAAHGFNLVRLGMNWSGIEPQPGVYDPAYLDSILGTMRLLEKHGIYTLLDWHQDDWGLAAAGIDGAPAWATLTDGLPNPSLGYGAGMFGDPAQMRAFDNFWANKAGPGGVGIADRFAAMLAYYGSVFRNEPYLLGYDTFNEPNTGSQWPTCTSPSGCPVFDSQLSAWFRQFLPPLRKADPDHLIWIEPNVFFDFAANTNLQDPNGSDPNTGFDFHTYCLGDGAAGFTQPVPGNAPGCTVEEDLNLNNATAYQQRTGVALLNSEWGATNDTTVVARQTAEFDSYMLGDVFWDYQQMVPNLEQTPGGKNEDAPLVSALERPYPQVVAGTPSGWSYDTSSDAFNLNYSTTLPDGRSGAGLQTEVYVPARHYPTGYSAVVSGATISGSSNATALQVVDERGARTVSVSVTPPTGSGAVAILPPAGSRCISRRLGVKLRLRRHERVLHVSLRLDGRKLGARRAQVRRHGRMLRIKLRRVASGSHVLVLSIVVRRGEHTRHILLVRRYRIC